MSERNQNIDNEIVYGRNAVTELLRSDNGVDTLFLSSDENDAANAYLVALAKEKGAVIKRVHPQKLSKLCMSERHQGVAVQCTLCVYRELDDLFQLAHDRGEAPFFLIADGVEDPHNLGAIIRTCECAGVHGIIIPERRGCRITSAVFRASAGACSHMLIHRAKNLASAMQTIKKRGVFCYCADMDGDSCYQTDLTGACALVIGSEGFGPSRLIKAQCDGVVSLPLKGQVNSLNASVAAGLLVYEAVRQNLVKQGGGGR